MEAQLRLLLNEVRAEELCILERPEEPALVDGRWLGRVARAVGPVLGGGLGGTHDAVRHEHLLQLRVVDVYGRDGRGGGGPVRGRHRPPAKRPLRFFTKGFVLREANPAVTVEVHVVEELRDELQRAVHRRHVTGGQERDELGAVEEAVAVGVVRFEGFGVGRADGGFERGRVLRLCC